MQTSIETSELMSHRISLVPAQTEKIIEAIKKKDFPTFARITIQVCATLHQSMLALGRLF